MTESAMFKPEYTKTLPVAPKIFKADETIYSKDMPKPAGLWEKREGYLGEYEINPNCLRPSIGHVVMAFQLKNGGGGHVRARFGKFLAEWHFKSNQTINQKRN